MNRCRCGQPHVLQIRTRCSAPRARPHACQRRAESRMLCAGLNVQNARAAAAPTPQPRTRRAPRLLTRRPPAQVTEAIGYEFRVAAAATPTTCAERPGVGGPEPTVEELACLFDLMQVGALHRRAFPFNRTMCGAPGGRLCRGAHCFSPWVCRLTCGRGPGPAGAAGRRGGSRQRAAQGRGGGNSGADRRGWPASSTSSRWSPFLPSV